MISIEEIKEKGVVGSGGAGFPCYVKVGSEAEILIVNAAECEPLLHKDIAILLHRTETFLKGLSYAVALSSAQRVIIGIKKKHEEVIEHLQSLVPNNVTLFPMRDFYPAGDEITLIYETTGRIVAPGKLPITQHVIVNNVETLYNLGKSGPVISKFLTVGGEVENPVSVDVPIGTPYRDVLKIARPKLEKFVVLVGGPMMGMLAESLNDPVIKTTGGLIVLPLDHILVTRMTTAANEKSVNRIAKSACDQCTFCSELCPRALLGHPVRPHNAMRKLLFSWESVVIDSASAHTLFCCECNLCSVVACPEGLYPSQACIYSKRAVSKEKIQFNGGFSDSAHPLIEYRRTPTKKIKERLDLNRFLDRGPLSEFMDQSRRLEILLRQHIGAPAESLVVEGQAVKRGEKIATVGDQLGAEIHSSSAGVVIEVNRKAIVIERRETT